MNEKRLQFRLVTGVKRHKSRQTSCDRVSEMSEFNETISRKMEFKSKIYRKIEIRFAHFFPRSMNKLTTIQLTLTLKMGIPTMPLMCERMKRFMQRVSFSIYVCECIADGLPILTGKRDFRLMNINLSLRRMTHSLHPT